jgi:hypothetical protein
LPPALLLQTHHGYSWMKVVTMSRSLQVSQSFPFLPGRAHFWSDWCRSHPKPAESCRPKPMQTSGRQARTRLTGPNQHAHRAFRVVCPSSYPRPEPSYPKPVLAGSPSGENATDRTEPVCPSSVCSSCLSSFPRSEPSCRPQSMRVGDRPPRMRLTWRTCMSFEQTCIRFEG